MRTVLHGRPAAGVEGEVTVSRCAVARRRLPTVTALIVAVASSIVMTLAGCASTGGVGPQATPLDAAQLGLGGTAAPGDALAPAWWEGFGDPTLSALVERALAESPTLRASQARIERAAASVALATSANGPQVNGTADATRQRFSANSVYPPPLAGSQRTLGTLQAAGSWDLDLFGRNRAALEAAIGASRAAEADREAARVLLSTNVVRAYLQLARLGEQREVAERTLAQRDALLGLVRQRVQAGLDTTVELRQGEGALPEIRQQIEAIDEQRTLMRHALAALTVQAPSALDTLQPRLAAITSVALPATIPADLIGRRADITAARWRIESATQEVAAARAQFYPNVNLSAFVGLASIGLDRLLRAGSEQYGIGPAIRLPIFDAGRLRANLRGRAADLDLAVESYNAAVVDAVREAADQIGSMQSIARQRQEQALAASAAESAFDLATQRYRAGLSSYLTVLNAEAAVLNQRRGAADLQARALDAQVGLVRALGGGYVVPGVDGGAAAHQAHLTPR